jgi:hypothetical protein
MPPVLIDSDIAIDYLRGIPYAKELMTKLWDENAAHLSILSVYELYAGLKEKERIDTENFINACNIEYITYKIAEKGGELYRHYKKKGITLTTVDCLIAATAIINGYKIATNNVEHYPEKGLLYHLKK